MGREVGDASMQGMNQLAPLIVLRRTVAGQSTADQQFCETVQPTKSTRFADRDVVRMNRAPLGAAPGEFLFTALNALQAEPAGGNQRGGTARVPFDSQ